MWKCWLVTSAAVHAIKILFSISGIDLIDLVLQNFRSLYSSFVQSLVYGQTNLNQRIILSC